MKKVVFRVLLSGLADFLIQAPLLAQETTGNHTVKLAAGVYNAEVFMDLADDVIGGSLFGYETKRKYGPVMTLNYRYSPAGKFGIGFAYAMQSSSGELFQKEKLIEKFHRFSHTLAGEFTMVYFRELNYTVYGLAGFGMTINQLTYSPAEGSDTFNRQDNHFNVQLSPAGFRFGRKIGFAFELGYGYKGILNAGIDYQF